MKLFSLRRTTRKYLHTFIGKYFHTITAKYFLATTLLVIFPICIFFQISTKYNFNSTLSQKKHSDITTLNIFSANINTWMDSVSSISSLAATDPDVQKFLRESTHTAKTFGKISYIDMDNRPYLTHYADSNDSILAFSLMDSDFFLIGEQTLNRNRLNYYFNSPNLNSIQNAPDSSFWAKTCSIEFLDSHSVHKVFPFFYPSIDSSGTLLGYLIAFVDTSYFSEILDVYDDNIYVIEGDIIIGSKKDFSFNSNLFSKMHISYSMLMEDNSVIIDQEDDSIIVTTRFFEPLDIHLLLTSSYMDLEEQQTSTVPPLLSIVLYIIVLTLLLAFVITFFQTRHIIELKNVMNIIKDGNLNVRYQPQTRDEIAELGITFNSLLDQIQLLMQEQKNAQKAKRRMELQMIHEQLKPHFLYNVLEMINSMIRCNMSQKALLAIENLAGFYRISLNRGSNIISVESEIQLIEKYLSLQKMRYIEFMDYVLAFSPRIQKYMIPKLTLQPLIENSIYHGIKEKDEKGIICVSGYVENDYVTFEVFDTGIGISPDKLQELQNLISSNNTDSENHFGLLSVIRRLNIYYNDQASLQIDSVAGEYTCIKITFPAKEYERK